MDLAEGHTVGLLVYQRKKSSNVSHSIHIFRLSIAGPHRLLNKLDIHGIRNKTHTWVSNFLKYRKQRVVIGGEHSTWTHVMSGVGETGAG